MPAEATAPSAHEIDPFTLQQILATYPAVVESFYRDKVKGDDKKRAEAQEDDDWRYVQLPKEVEQRGSKKALSKAELERLVKWKITHQTNRPFLLPQIRKNDPKTVETCISDARNILFESKHAKARKPHSLSLEGIRKALNKVCELNGVGPATGTLILSVYDGHNIPFFEDELHAWLFPDFKGKLKYNVKEYFDILNKFRDLSTSNFEVEDNSPVSATTFEKVAFVCHHWDHVSEEDKVKILQPSQTRNRDGKSRVAMHKQEEESTLEQVPAVKRSEVVTPAAVKKVKGKREAKESEGQPTGNRRSKRTKKSGELATDNHGKP